jgi:hypothetical protein
MKQNEILPGVMKDPATGRIAATRDVEREQERGRQFVAAGGRSDQVDMFYNFFDPNIRKRRTSSQYSNLLAGRDRLAKLQRMGQIAANAEGNDPFLRGLLEYATKRVANVERSAGLQVSDMTTGTLI